MALSSFIFLISLILNDLFLKALAIFFKYVTFWRDRPALFRLRAGNFKIVSGLIFFLHLASNFNQIESAALVLICCPTIVRHMEKKGLFFVVKTFIIFIYYFS